MKQLIKLILLPLLLSQGVAVAQTDPSNRSDRPTQSSAPATSIDRPQQPLIPLRGTDQIQLQLVNCSGLLDCALASLLLPKSTRINQLQLQFDNPASVPTQILNTATVVRGNFTGYQLTDAFSVPQGSQTLAANQIVSLPLILNRSAMPPDQYGGAIYLTLPNQTNRLVLPVNLNVRSGPLLPLFILLIGIVLGRLFKYMQEQGGPQAEARKKVYQLEADLKEAHPDDQKLLANRVKQARNLVYRQQLEAANTQSTVVLSRLNVLTQLRSLETILNERAKNDEDVPDEAFEQISQVRTEIEQGLDAKAKETLDQVSEIVNHMDHVIGMEQETRDDAAIAFSKGFYRALGYDCSIEEAYEFGCNAIQLEITNHSTVRSAATELTRKAEVVKAVATTIIPEHMKPILKKREGA